MDGYVQQQQIGKGAYGVAYIVKSKVGAPSPSLALCRQSLSRSKACRDQFLLVCADIAHFRCRRPMVSAMCSRSVCQHLGHVMHGAPQYMTFACCTACIEGHVCLHTQVLKPMSFTSSQAFIIGIRCGSAPLWPEP